MKECGKLYAVKLNKELTVYGVLLDSSNRYLLKPEVAKEKFIDTLYESLKAGEKSKGKNTGITREDIAKIVERELK